jgi:hypothetical protein
MAHGDTADRRTWAKPHELLEEPVTVLNLNDRADEVRDWAKLIGNELAENSPI